MAVNIPKIVDEFVDELEDRLELGKLDEYGPLESVSLRRSLSRCGLSGYPPLSGPEDGYRCSGKMICGACGNDYYSHPMDWRVIGYGGRPFLNVICSGERVKL